ncbi:MAG: Crp/Fnr family transcriptional regulator [Ginsengibacter sp.]|jgi:CRP-like cAMP-binding protein
MPSNFEIYLISNTGVAADEIKNLTSTLIEKKVSKGTFLLREGEIGKHAFFVEAGLLRVYTIGESGKEHVIQFAPKDWFFSDRSSLYFNEPSSYFVEAIEDSVVVFLPKDFFDSDSPDILRRLNDRLLNNHIRHLQRRINLLLGANAEQRYIEFMKLYPDLMLRVPQWMIASYLGITPEGLSRVRKILAHHNP